MGKSGAESQNIDLIKSTFMLTEIMFSISCDQTHVLVITECINQLYETVDSFMIALNNDIMALNMTLK